MILKEKQASPALFPAKLYSLFLKDRGGRRKQGEPGAARFTIVRCWCKGLGAHWLAAAELVMLSSYGAAISLQLHHFWAQAVSAKTTNEAAFKGWQSTLNGRKKRIPRGCWQDLQCHSVWALNRSQRTSNRWNPSSSSFLEEAGHLISRGGRCRETEGTDN